MIVVAMSVDKNINSVKISPRAKIQPELILNFFMILDGCSCALSESFFILYAVASVSIYRYNMIRNDVEAYLS